VPRPGRKSSAGQGQGDVFSNRAGDRHGARSEAAIPDQDEACGPGQAGAAAHTRVLLPRIRALLLAQAVRVAWLGPGSQAGLGVDVKCSLLSNDCRSCTSCKA
jgi:hypothetical protein